MSRKAKVKITKKSDITDALDGGAELDILASELEIYLMEDKTYKSLGQALKSTRSLKRLSLHLESFKPTEAIFNGIMYNESIETFKFAGSMEAREYYSSTFQPGNAFGKLLLKNKTIKSLAVTDVDFNAHDFVALGKALTTNQSLTSLSLTLCDLSNGAEYIAEALKTNTKITSLDFSHNSLVDVGCKALGELMKNNNTITSLNLSGMKVLSEGWKEFFGGLKMNLSLTELDVSQSTTLAPTDCVHLNEVLKHNKALMHLDLNSNAVRSDGLNALLKDLDVKNSEFGLLTSINLRNTKLDSACCEALCKYVSVNDKMTELDLSFNNITADGCKWVGTMLKHNKTLTELRLSFNKIKSEGAQWLAEGLKSNTRLIRVALDECGITSDGCTHIAAAIAVNPCLMHVNLNGNDIGAQGCAALVEAMKVNQSVTQLSITKSKAITEATLKEIIDAQNRNKIAHRLSLSNVMTTLITMARRTDDITSLLPMEMWVHVFKQCVCGGVPGFDQIALDLFTNRIDCRDISSLVKMKIVRRRGKSTLEIFVNSQNDDEA